MSLAPGTRLGVYDITAPLGEGGMGQVWRATDSTLGRQVAIKILPDAFATDPERLARFEREAKTLASLNHPHIAAIYGFEKSSAMHALVMELVEGEDLSQRIARGALPLDEALPIAKQIAEALEAAHEQGIIHRDLKPANVKVRPDGTVKVLDFGLAKAMEQGSGIGDQGSAHLANSPTITSPAMTMRGMILGTAAYMSPEQAAGKPVDKRSDLWAFGAVLLEMLSGRPAFSGETVSHVMASVLKSEPDWTALPAETPATIRRLMRRCLEKDRKRRLADASDARLDIEEALADPRQVVSAPAPTPTKPWMSALPWALFGVTAVVAVALLARGTTAPDPATRLVSRALIDFPQFAFSGARLGNLFALSPDGTRLVFAGNPDGRNKLYLRSLDQFEATAIPGTEEGSQPFFSPDGGSIGFFAGGKLKKVSLAGGAPVSLADAPNPTGGSWGEDDTIIFGPDLRGLMKTSAAGAQPQRVTERQAASGLHGAPLLLPGGKAVVFTNSESSLVRPAVDVVSLETGKLSRLFEDGCCPAFAQTTGHLIYAHSTSGAMFAAPFDPERPTVVGESARVMDGVMAGGLNGGQFATSLSGSLVYLTNTAVNERSFVWVDRAGRATALDFDKRTYGLPSLSPDGRRVATGVYDGLNPKEIWVGDLDRGTMNRLVTDGSLNAAPIWTPDGSRVAFASRREATVQNIYWTLADGSGVTERLTTGEFNEVPTDWSPDGKTLAFYETNPTSGYDLRTLALDRERTVKPLVATPFNEMGARFSLDGRYLAFLSDRTGRQEVYVQPFPGPGEPRQVSTDGGTEPVWARNGRELFFKQGEKMMVVDVTLAPTFTASRPRLLFEGRYEVSFLVSGMRFYDVSPDGRFLMVKSDTPTTPRQLHLVVNWFEELKRLVPARR